MTGGRCQFWSGAPTHGFFGALVYDSATGTWHVSDGWGHHCC